MSTNNPHIYGFDAANDEIVKAITDKYNRLDTLVLLEKYLRTFHRNFRWLQKHKSKVKNYHLPIWVIKRYCQLCHYKSDWYSSFSWIDELLQLTKNYELLNQESKETLEYQDVYRFLQVQGLGTETETGTRNYYYGLVLQGLKTGCIVRIRFQ